MYLVNYLPPKILNNGNFEEEKWTPPTSGVEREFEGKLLLDTYVTMDLSIESIDYSLKLRTPEISI